MPVAHTFPAARGRKRTTSTDLGRRNTRALAIREAVSGTLDNTHIGTQFARACDQGGVSPRIVHELLATSGQPVHPTARAVMEPRFGHDFGQLRVHTDARAAESARVVNALAYTVGTHIVFGAGQYAPCTLAGQRLLAHELTHSLQQAEGVTAGTVRIADPRAPAEAEAERVAGDAVAGRQANITTAASAPMLRRQPLPDVTLRSSPLAGRLIGSELLDGFALSAAFTEEHKGRRLAILAITLRSLLGAYPTGSVGITRMQAARKNSIKALAIEQPCLDTMADREGQTAFSHSIRISLPGGQVMVGCCRRVPRAAASASTDSGDLPVSDFSAKPADDWSRLPLCLAPAVEACLSAPP